MAEQTGGLRCFQWVARLTGVGFLLFFGLAFVMILTGLDNWLLQYEWGKLVMRLLRWGDQTGGAEHYELMISIIYIIWGGFLIRAASKPLQHALFFDFTALANIAHFGAMFLMALLMQHEMIHLAGDVLLGWLSLGVFIVFWLPVRRLAISSRG